MSFEEEDMFGGLDEETLNPSPGSLGGTPLDFSGVVGPPGSIPEPSLPKASDATFHRCPEPGCGKTYKTKGRFTRHLLEHKMNDYNARKPLEEEITGAMNNLFKSVLGDIAAEPAVGEMGAEKRSFIASLLPEVHMPNCVDFLSALSEPIMECVLNRSKVMPSVHFEAALKGINHLLASPDFSKSMLQKLLLCVAEEKRKISSEVGQRLVWRISSLLMSKIQELVCKCMKKKNEEAQTMFTMSEGDLSAFKDHVGCMLRALHRVGNKSKNSTWELRCQTLRARFVSGDDVNSVTFMDRTAWGNSIVLSSVGLNLFLGLERVVQSCQGLCTAEVVFNSLSNAENHVILDQMRLLSRGILSEDMALSFLQDIIKSFTATSGRLEARKIKSKKQSAATVSLRTNLKRNPKQKQANTALTEEVGVEKIQPTAQVQKPTTRRQTRSAASASVVQSKPKRNQADQNPTPKKSKSK